MLVSQREARVEVYTRQADGSFRFTVHGSGSTLRLEAIGVVLAVDELYGGGWELPDDSIASPEPV